MKKFLLVVALLATAPSFAQEKPASEASVREVIALTDAKSLLENAYSQIDGMMDQQMKHALAGQTVTDEQQKILTELQHKTVALVRSEMSWEKLEPDYIKLYSTTFSQSEIDGMVKFYKTPAGKAVVKKLPQLTDGIMQTVMAKVQGMAPQLRSLSEEYVQKLKAAGKP